MLGLIAGFLLGAGYKNTKTEAINEFNPFVNDQVEVIFKSELEACNLKWSNSCGIGVERINDSTYYAINTKDIYLRFTLSQLSCKVSFTLSFLANITRPLVSLSSLCTTKTL